MKNTYFSGIQLLKQIGTGTYGKIFEVLIKDTQCAIKIITRCDGDGLSGLNELNELNSLMSFSHPHIIHIIDVKFDTFNSFQTFGMLFPMAKYTLHTASENKENRKFITTWMYQLLSAVNFLHTHDVCHNDIKLNNILVMEDDSVVLADLGLVRNVNCTTTGYVYQTITSPQLLYRSARDFNGDHQSWEELWKDSYTKNVVKQQSSMIEDDIWALGYAFYELIYNLYQCNKKIKNNSPEWYTYYISKVGCGIEYFSTNGVPEKYADVLKKLMNPIAEMRNMNLLELLKLPVFNEYPDGGFDEYINGTVKNNIQLTCPKNFTPPTQTNISTYNNGFGHYIKLDWITCRRFRHYVIPHFIDLCYRCHDYISDRGGVSLIYYDVLYSIVLKIQRIDYPTINPSIRVRFLEMEREIIQHLNGLILRDNIANCLTHRGQCDAFIDWYMKNQHEYMSSSKEVILKLL